MQIPFNKPYLTGNEQAYMQEALVNGKLEGDGVFGQKCHAWLRQRVGCAKAVLTPSGTAALELAAILSGVGPGDEVIMPDYTFVSTANAYALRGAVPVFIDIREDTLNIDETRIEAAITERTKIIAPVHYAGVGCDMKAIMAIAEKHGLLVIEDAAHGVMASYNGTALGGIGHLAAYSFHETKNIIAGQGGALLVNDDRFSDRADIVRFKGTNRANFLRGEVNKYGWVDIGSSYVPNEMTAAFLWAQMEAAEPITAARLAVWDRYQQAFSKSNVAGDLFRVPVVPAGCRHNAHIYYLIMKDAATCEALRVYLKERGIGASGHYLPLHDSDGGRALGRVHGDLTVSRDMSARILRLPVWVGLEDQVDTVIDAVMAFASEHVGVS